MIIYLCCCICCVQCIVFNYSFVFISFTFIIFTNVNKYYIYFSILVFMISARIFNFGAKNNK